VRAKRTTSYRAGNKCENALITYGDATNKHFPDRREIKALTWCENTAEYAVTGRNIPRTSLYCGDCASKIDRNAMIVEKL
jgi:hypothetical protein